MNEIKKYEKINKLEEKKNKFVPRCSASDTPFRVDDKSVLGREFLTDKTMMMMMMKRR